MDAWTSPPATPAARHASRQHPSGADLSSSPRCSLNLSYHTSAFPFHFCLLPFMAQATLAAARFPASVALLRTRRSPAVAAPLCTYGLQRGVAMAAAHSPAPVPASDPPPKGADLFFRSVLSNMQKVYLSRNPTAEKILGLVRSYDGDNICFDHFAFRTFALDGYGINSLAEFFTDFGYKSREELRFPAKKLRALWFSPPKSDGYSGTGTYGPLPRIFISELLVDELSAPSQVVLWLFI
uniref:Uncharacterized protein n=1 Tax=Avena sativa TaxID=4498 RepID=A0ACD5W5E5_AVESA